MRDTYTKLLDATIQHLEGLKARGTKFVSVSEETLAALSSARINRPQSVTSVAEASNLKSQPIQNSPPLRAKTPEVSRPATEAPNSEPKEVAFADLRRRALACVKCPHLASSRKN